MNTITFKVGLQPFANRGLGITYETIFGKGWLLMYGNSGYGPWNWVDLLVQLAGEIGPHN